MENKGCLASGIGEKNFFWGVFLIINIYRDGKYYGTCIEI